MTDGPFPETKAVVGGFAIVEVETRDDAHAWAAKIAAACRCAQEVRELIYDPES
ncbi:MAG: YciI family protein [Thermomicrobiales bacterium]